MKPYSLTIPISPQAASRPRVTQRGTYHAPKYRAWRQEMKALLTSLWTNAPIGCPIRIDAEFFVPRPKSTKLPFPKPDSDNYLKALLDAANGIIWEDDWLIQSGAFHKEWSDKGRIVLTITTI